jgi:hypothetical protein
VKDLPPHIRENFRDRFIRFVIRDVAKSTSPWVNPDTHSLQPMYQIVYPMFPAQLRHNDAVHNPVSNLLFAIIQSSDPNRKTNTAIGFLRNQISVVAVTTIQRHLPNVFDQKKLQTIEARAEYISKLFKPGDRDHPIIWREYTETTKTGIDGRNPVSRIVVSHFLLLTIYADEARPFPIGTNTGNTSPLLHVVMGYYGRPPIEDPGFGQRPLGILALVTAAVSSNTLSPSAPY